MSAGKRLTRGGPRKPTAPRGPSAKIVSKRRKEVLAEFGLQGAAREAKAGLKALRALRVAGTKARRPRKEKAPPEALLDSGPLVPAELIELDQEGVRGLLLKHDGNISAVALALGCDPARLRAYVQGMPRLVETVTETIEVGADLAIATLFEALRDRENFQNRFYAAKEFLRSETGRKRGFGRMDLGRPALEVRAGQGAERPTGVIQLKWIDPPKEKET